MEATKSLSTINVSLLADFVLSKFGPMSHLKLQKLIYYCEAYHLAYLGGSIINEDFQAWVHGPVCVELYHALKGESVLYSDVAFNGNYNPEKKIKEQITSSQFDLLNDVLTSLSTWSGAELEATTHNETPWIDARRGYGPAEICNNIISKPLMTIFYKSELRD